MKHLLFTLLISLSTACLAEDPETILGKWKTIDDVTGKPKSIISLYMKDDHMYGRIQQIFRTPDEEQDPICDLCPGDRHNQKVVGMEIIRDMQWNGETWAEGEILDPENGKTYRCELWMEDGHLKVRGYLLFFFRTQTWIRT